MVYVGFKPAPLAMFHDTKVLLIFKTLHVPRTELTVNIELIPSSLVGYHYYLLDIKQNHCVSVSFL